MNASSSVRLSVVIPTMGRPILIKTLESLIATRDFEHIEVVVAGKISDSHVLERLQLMQKEHPRLVHLPVSFPVGDSSQKKNEGFRRSRADIVAFLDDDVYVCEDWPELILKPFEDAGVGAASGPSLVPDDVKLFTRLAGTALQSKAAGYVAERYLKAGEHIRPISWSRIIGCNMAYRRTVLESIGLFPPEFWPGEEMIAAWKTQQAGHRIVFYDEAWVYHYPRASLWRYLKQMHGYGATRIRLLRAGVEFEPTTIVPGLWVLSLVVFGIAACFSTWGSTLLLLDLFAYLLAVLYITLGKYAETRRLEHLLIFFLVPLMHLSYGIAEWVEFFRPNKDLSEG